MRYQGDLFAPMCGRMERGRQGDLFGDVDALVGLVCVECDSQLVPTDSGYWACPNGHGRLTLIAEAGDDTSSPEDAS